MNDPGTIPPLTGPNLNPVDHPAIPTNWRTALADLVGARFALVQAELKESASSGIKRVAFFGAGALFLLFAWGLIVAGAVGAIAGEAGYPWYWVTLIAGGIHLLLAGIVIVLAKRPAQGPSFHFTREEFKKDRAWLENFQSPKKSND
jgi:Protein of unknown function (DUF1469).